MTLYVTVRLLDSRLWLCLSHSLTSQTWFKLFRYFFPRQCVSWLVLQWWKLLKAEVKFGFTGALYWHDCVIFNLFLKFFISAYDKIKQKLCKIMTQFRKIIYRGCCEQFHAGTTFLLVGTTFLPTWNCSQLGLIWGWTVPLRNTVVGVDLKIGR